MLFTSYEFIAFAAALLVLYYIVPKRTQWWLLLAASYIFYGLAGTNYLIFIIGLTLTAYVTACIIGRMAATEDNYVQDHKDEMSKDQRKAFRAVGKRRRLIVLTVGLVIGFSVLAVIKYTAFAVTNVNTVLGWFNAGKLTVPQLLLPMGISFYTFQSMGYLIDVYRGKAQPERNLAKFALFVSYFPQLVQGPISRFNDLSAQLCDQHKFEFKNVAFGLERVLWGYFKKLVVADRMLVAVKALMEKPEEYNGMYVFLLIIFYSIEIYADFTGGIDITIGLSEALGIRLAENFKHPFFSKSTKEYWRRWHITMGTWFSDYIFYPLSVSKPMQKLSKKSRALLGNELGKRIPVYLATLATWFLTGLWHGAGWNFIVWGLLNAAIILISQELSPLYNKFHAKFPGASKSNSYAVFSMTRTFLLMGTVRILDCYRNVPLTFKMMGSMFYKFNWGELFNGGVLSLGLGWQDYVVVLVSCVIMIIVSALCEKFDVRQKLWNRPGLYMVSVVAMLISIIIFGAYGIGYDASQFIYNQF